MTYDTYVKFWDDSRKEPDWNKARKLNTYLTFRLKLCALYMLNKKEKKENGKRKLKDIIFEREYRWKGNSKMYLRNELSELKSEMQNVLKFDHNDTPEYSTYIQIKFKLKKPFLSKDDDEFYILDNPIVKDKVFKLPMVRASTWKGALRFAAIKVFEEKIDENNWKDERLKIFRLFGHEKGIDDKIENYLDKIVANKVNKPEEEVREEFKRFVKEKVSDIHFKGRLFFYPTFFDVISLDVITPLSRVTKTPVERRGPIYFETVPEGREGKFRLLYYPYDSVARGKFDDIEKELEEDIEFLAKALQKMFYEIGFSAKKTSGFGVISEFNGKILTPFKNINLNFKSFDELDFSKLRTKVNNIVNHGASK